MTSRTPRLYSALATINYPVQTLHDQPLADAVDATNLANAIESLLRRKGNATSFVIVISRAPRMVMCEECGTNPADPPSNICPGCEAYKEHQR